MHALLDAPPCTAYLLTKLPFALALLFYLSFVCANYSFSQNCRCTYLNHLILSWRLRNLLVFYLNSMKFFGTTFHNVSPGVSSFI